MAMSETHKAVESLLVAAAENLMEHCSSVVIVVTFENEDKLYDSLSIRKGNLYAAVESVREFLLRDERKEKFMHEKELREGEGI